MLPAKHSSSMNITVQAGCKEIKIPNSTPTSQFYFNSENGVGLLVTDSGKSAAGPGMITEIL